MPLKKNSSVLHSPLGSHAVSERTLVLFEVKEFVIRPSSKFVRSCQFLFPLVLYEKLAELKNRDFENAYEVIHHSTSMQVRSSTGSPLNSLAKYNQSSWQPYLNMVCRAAVFRDIRPIIHISLAGNETNCR